MAVREEVRTPLEELDEADHVPRLPPPGKNAPLVQSGNS